MKLYNFIVFDISLFFLFQNIVLLMLLFWLLSWLGDKFYKIKIHKSSDNIYECGFTSVHALRVSINFGFFIIALLLILYDIEFLFLIPVYFNFTSLQFSALIIYWIFLLFIIGTFLLDWESITLKWIK